MNVLRRAKSKGENGKLASLQGDMPELVRICIYEVTINCFFKIES